MQRINSANVQADKFGAGKNGFHGGNVSTGVQATFLTPDWCDSVQEELANAIELYGVALDPNNRAQLKNLLSSFLLRSGNQAMTGLFDLSGDAVSPLNPTTLQQVQALISSLGLQFNSRPGHTYSSDDWIWLDKGRDIVLQYGQVGTLGPSGTAAITFSTVFTTLPFIRGALPTSSTAFSLSAESPTLSGMTVRNGNSSSATSAIWFALGKV